MKINKIIVGTLFVFCCFNVGLTQDDSLKYWKKQVFDTSLTMEQRRPFALKWRNAVKQQGQKEAQRIQKEQNKIIESQRRALDSLSFLSAYFKKMNDSILMTLKAMALDTAIQKEIRYCSLEKIASINTPEAFSFLLDNLNTITWLNEPISGAEDEFHGGFSCFKLILPNIQHNWKLYPLINLTLHLVKNEEELDAIAFIYKNITNKNIALQAIEFYLDQEQENQILINNLTKIKELINQN
jgi:hypothetical protein